jgi:riboflavin transporter FmnP
MMIGKFVPFGPLTFLEIEPSDSVVLVAYVFYGFWASSFVAVAKTLLTMLTFGPVGTPIPIGQITALITSLTYSFGLFVMDKGFSAFSRGLKYRILSYVFITLLVASLMTYLNYLFITPTFMTYGAEFLTVYDFETRSDLSDTFRQYFSVFPDSYPLAIFLAYFPFNLVKGALVCFVYELLCNRVIFQVLKSGVLRTNAFMKEEDFHAESPFVSLLVLAKREALKKEKQEKREAKEAAKEEKGRKSRSFITPIVKTMYNYSGFIQEGANRIPFFIESEKDPEGFATDYMSLNYPYRNFEVVSVQTGKTEVHTAETDEVSESFFFALYHCDKMILTDKVVVIDMD